jgi:hypothetical protein
MDPEPAGTDRAPEQVIEKMEAQKQAKGRREETDQV